MSFKTIEQFEKSFPEIKSLSKRQKRIAWQIFNDELKIDIDKVIAINKAINSAKRMSEEARILSEIVITKDELEDTEFEVLREGEYFDSRYNKFKITKEKLKKLKQNFDNDVLEIDIALDLNHDENNKAYAWIRELSIHETENGKQAIFAKFRDFTDEGKQFFLQKMYKYFSVEFASFTKVVNGKKKTFFDVLRGIAICNRPVIKGMKPTFFAENINKSLTNNIYTMSILMKLADDILSRDEITKADAEFLQMQFNEAPDEEKTEELEGKVKEVETKAEEAEVEKEKADDKAKEKAEAKAEEEEEEEGDKKKEDDTEKLSEKLSETEKQMNILLAEKDARILKDRVSKLILSETNSVGFTKKLSDKVASFVGSLDDEQYEVFSELMPNVKNVALGEVGHSQSVESNDKPKDVRIVELSEKLLSEGKAKNIDEAQKKATELINK